MDSKRIEDKVDVMQADITEIKVTLAVNTESLKQHMRRTAALEALVIPVDAHVKMVNGVLKFIGVLAAIAAIVEVFLMALRHS